MRLVHVLFFSLAVSLASAQSLGDAARQNRKSQAKSTEKRVLQNEDVEREKRPPAAENLEPPSGAPKQADAGKPPTGKRTPEQWRAIVRQLEQRVNDRKRDLTSFERENRAYADVAAVDEKAGKFVSPCRPWDHACEFWRPSRDKEDAAKWSAYKENLAQKKQAVVEATAALEAEIDAARRENIFLR
jgi:hypothetical protein